ncbi:GNAT family N-acetyltransferase [Streptacidiphilus jiangxiensis]|uniref:Acetyltransferase (GNAT) domain-containing protein n=1 Tax=Streptacidiphilus jiangxiensis TaxID=235985 RepID=A0A1H8AWR5_STRJI|nr:GNAT family N-acetyltransferase [Streptacidiphilus jiangxiensis]SEM75115.1 Acetyltransferase (GNAT) domain-containing protein [Streptacidiphilus jiangxiensis]
MRWFDRRPRCPSGLHVEHTANLIVRSPVDDMDYLGSCTGAYDPEAQHWLGWGTEGPEQWQVDWFDDISHANREHMHTHLDGSGNHTYQDKLGYAHFTVLTRDEGRYAGAIQLIPAGKDVLAVEAWLNLPYRRLGLGKELFRAAARLGHHHLGAPRVTANVEVDHTAALRALEQAGYSRQPPPYTHAILGDGRNVTGPTYLHHHPGARTCRCGSATKAAAPGGG